MANQIVPLTNSPNQTFATQLTVNEQPLTLSLNISYNSMAGYWQMAITDVTGKSIVACVPMITGWYPGGNLLAQYQYLNIGSAYLLNTGNANTDYPSSNNLDKFSLLWGDTVV